MHEKKLWLSMILGSMIFTAQACNEEGTYNTDCVEGEYNCKDSVLRECQRGLWTGVEICDSAEACDEEAGICHREKICETGEERCSGDSLGIEVCHNEVEWVVSKACGENTSCKENSAGVPECEAVLTCKEGSTRCTSDFSSVEICNGSVWTVRDSCEEDAICQVTNVGHECIVPQEGCAEGVTICRDNAIVACVDGEEMITACEDDTPICADRDGVVSCEAALCQPDTFDCEGNDLMKCGDNEWVLHSACSAEEICNAVKGACDAKVCEPNTTQCKNNAVERCENNEWVVDTACDALTCEWVDTEHACVQRDCVEDTSRCDSQTLQKCTGGTWVEDTVCSNVGKLCKEANETASCVDIVCTSNDNKCEGNVLVVCKDNDWVETPCAGDKPVCDPNKLACVAAECSEPSTKCGSGEQSNTVMSCENGLWVESEACGNDKVCDGPTDAALCAEIVCTPGQRQCGGQSLEECNSRGTGWNVTKTCGGTTPVCDAVAGCVECTVSSHCDEGVECREELICGECVEDTVTCSADKKTESVCLYGVLLTESCQGDFVCEEGEGCVAPPFVCKDSDFQCTAEGMLQGCENNVWKDMLDEPCVAPLICSKEIGECIDPDAYCPDNFEVRCTAEGMLQSCEAHLWTDELDEPCVAPFECSDTELKCVNTQPQCQGDEIQCDDNKLMMCDEDQMWLLIYDCNEKDSICSETEGQCIANTSEEISWAATNGFATDTYKIYAEVYIIPWTGLSEPPAELKAQVVCTDGLGSLPMKDWTVVTDGVFLQKDGPSNNNFKYETQLSTPATDQYCMYRFSTNSGITWIYAPKENNQQLGPEDIVVDFEDKAWLVEADSTSPINWAYIEDFDGTYSGNAGYIGLKTADNTPSGLVVQFTGTRNAEIENTALTWSSGSTHGNQYLTAVYNDEVTFGTLAFDYKGWDGDTFTNYVISISIDDTVVDTMEINTVETLPLGAYHKVLNTKGKELKISRSSASTKNTYPRFILDNVRWTH